MTREDAVRATSPAAFLAGPWDDASEAALLEHLRARSNVHCFVVADPDATRRDRIDGVLMGLFELNGETHTLPSPIDWLRNPSADLEWHIRIVILTAFDLFREVEGWQMQVQMPPVNSRGFVLIPVLARCIGDQ